MRWANPARLSGAGAVHHTAFRAPPGRRVADDEPIRWSSGDSNPRTQSAKRPLPAVTGRFGSFQPRGHLRWSVGRRRRPAICCRSWRIQISDRVHASPDHHRVHRSRRRPGGWSDHMAASYWQRFPSCACARALVSSAFGLQPWSVHRLQRLTACGLDESWRCPHAALTADLAPPCNSGYPPTRLPPTSAP